MKKYFKILLLTIILGIIPIQVLADNNNSDEMRPQSMKIKNMAALLESQMKHNEKKIIAYNQ